MARPSPPSPVAGLADITRAVTALRDRFLQPWRPFADTGIPEIRYWVDFTCQFDRNPGIQRVTRALAQGLRELGQWTTYLAWSETDHGPGPCTRKQLRNLSRWHGPSYRLLGARHGPTRQDAQRKNAGWLLVPELTYWRIRDGRQEPWDSDPIEMLRRYAQAQGLRTVFLFHDLIPLRMPDYPQLTALHERYIRALVNADVILPVSTYAGSDLTSYFRETLRLGPGAEPTIVPHPLPHEFLGQPRATTYDVPSAGPVRILSVSHIEPRKNQIKLIEAFNAFCDEHPEADARLSLVGAINDDLLDQVTAMARRNARIELAGQVPESELIHRYRSCHFTAFPSIAEGYGLPIAESLWLGRPCLCADFGAMAELAAGGGCLAVDTRSIAALKHGLERLILKPALRQELAASAMRRPMRTWRDYAEGLVTILRR